jgi:acyl carrier protein/SAM-dependent methyltransferase
MDVMFPKGSMELVENIYRGNALSDFYNKEVARFLKIYTRERLNRDPDTPVQILEVGAGTGGTSAFVLAALKEYGDRVRCIYTDVSLKLILHGKDTFASRYPFARFNVFDIEKPPEEQDFEPNSIDLIFASNVLHATRNLDNTVNRLKGLLKTNGLLIINEVTRPGNFHSLTFGLTDGWWLFEDSANRIEGSPLVSRDNWKDLLKINGFRHVNIPEGPGEIDHEPWQSIIIGESDGEVIKERKKSAPQQVESLAPIPGVSIPVIKKQEKSQPESGAASLKNDELPDSRGEDLEEVIIGILSQILHIDKTEFAPDLSFQDYGVDSLLAVEIIDKLCETLNVSLRATDLFNFPTIRSLTGHIVKDPGYNPTPRRAGPVHALPVRQEKTGNNHNQDIDTAEESIETVLIENMEREEENGIIDDGTLLDLLQRLEVGELSSDEVDRLLEVGGL